MQQPRPLTIESPKLKSIAATLIFFAALNSNGFAAEPAPKPETGEVEIDVGPNAATADPSPLTPDRASFCFFSQNPPAEAQYTIVKKLKLGKGSYGGVKDILPRFAEQARKLGADAIMEYTGSQRFGFFPWRMVRPVVKGIAIKWVDPQKPNCNEIGGTTLKEIIESDKPPPQ